MQQPRNTRSFSELFVGFDKTIRHYAYDRPRAYLHTLRKKFENLPETNFTLGCSFAEQGKWLDAAFRFRLAIYLKPDFTQAHYNLGCCYAQLNKLPQAVASFNKALTLKPEHEDARFMLAGLTPNAPQPRAMPHGMVAGFFAHIAPEYDALAETNEYQGPRLIMEAAKPYLTKLADMHYLELGCGTGLVARPWRGMCREVLGVDVTPAMVAAAQVARAGDNPVYDRVLQADINSIPAGTFMPNVTDIVVCCDTAQYLGELTPLLKIASATLAPGGLFLLTVEPFAAPQGYAVNRATARFGHNPDYVRKLALAHGLELKRDGKVPLYAHQPAHLFVFAKKVA